MYFTILSINWTAQPLTGEQLLVLRNVAAQYLRKEKKGSTVDFSHPLCEGRITKKKQGVYGVFGGTFFFAELGVVRGEKWTADFMLPRGSEHFICDDDCEIHLVTRPLKGEAFETTKVDHTKAAIPEAHTLH